MRGNFFPGVKKQDMPPSKPTSPRTAPKSPPGKSKGAAKKTKVKATSTDLFNAVAGAAGVETKVAKTVISALPDALVKLLQTHEAVTLPGVGIVKRSPPKAVAPNAPLVPKPFSKTGEMVAPKAKPAKIKMSPAKPFRDKVLATPPRA